VRGLYYIQWENAKAELKVANSQTVHCFDDTKWNLCFKAYKVVYMCLDFVL